MARGWTWALERGLAELKSLIPWEKEWDITDDGVIQAMTEALASARAWTPRQAVDARRQMETEEPALVTACIAEAREAVADMMAIIWPAMEEAA